MYPKTNILTLFFFAPFIIFNTVSSSGATPINEISIRSYYHQKLIGIEESSVAYAHRADCQLANIDEKSDIFVIRYSCLFEHTGYEEYCYVIDSVEKDNDNIEGVQVNEDCEYLH